VQEPLFAETVELVRARAGIPGVYALEEAQVPATPPVTGFPPPVKGIFDPVQPLPPDEGAYRSSLFRWTLIGSPISLGITLTPEVDGILLY